MDNCVFVLLVMLFLCGVASLRAHTDDLDQTWTCDEVFNAWKPALGIINNDLINKTVVQYKKPPASTSSGHFGIEALTISLLQQDTYFDCRVELKERNRFVHTVIHVEKHDFCSNDYCEIIFDDLDFGYYCIQMEVRLANDSDAFDANSSHCKIIYMNETFKIDPGNVNASATLLAKTSRRYAAMSSMSTTWFVVGGLAVIGVFLAFALDKAHRRRHKHQYSSVIDSSRPTSIQMEVMSSPSNTSSGQLRMAKEMTGRLLVLYAYESHAHFLLVRHLVDLLKQTLPNWEVIFYEEHSKEIGSDGLDKWVHDEVYAADRIILVGSEKARRSHLSLNANIGHGDVNSVFSIAWNCILNDEKLRGNYAKVFNVRFDGGGVGSRDSSTPLLSGRNFVLPIEYVRLINHVLGNNFISEAFCRDLKQRVDEFQSYQLLEAAVEWMSADLRHNRRDLTPPIGHSHDLSWILNG